LDGGDDDGVIEMDGEDLFGWIWGKGEMNVDVEIGTSSFSKSNLRL
jgi:hypothetical protein